MKKSAIFVLCVLTAMLLASCGGGSGQLDGIWTGSIYGDDVTLVVVDNICFMREGRSVDAATFRLDGKSGDITFGRDKFPFTVEGKNIVVSVYGELFEFSRTAKADATPKALKGVWNGPYDTTLVFVNNFAYFIDDDGDADYASTYTFNKNEGSLRSTLYRYDVKFTVKGNSLNASIEDFGETLTFTRKK